MLKCKKLSIFLVFLLCSVPTLAGVLEIEKSRDEVKALGYQAPYFDNKLAEAGSLANNPDALDALTDEVVLQQKKMISLIELKNSLDDVIASHHYPLSTGQFTLLLNLNDFAAAEDELNKIVDEIAKIESGKALGGLINTLSFAERLKSFVNSYKYFLAALLAFVILLLLLFYKTMRYRYLRFRIQRFHAELDDLDILEKELQQSYYNRKEISKSEFDMKNDSYLKRKLDVEESLIEFQDKLRQ